jgi:hypothetical protein
LRRFAAASLVLMLVPAAACSGAAAPDTPTPSSADAGQPSVASPAPTVFVGLPLPADGPSPPSTDPVAVASPSSGAWPAPGASGPSVVVQANTAAFGMDLYRRGDFVSEVRTDWCVPAAIEMMALLDGASRSSLPSQDALNLRARALSSSRLVGSGSEPQGWAGVLNRLRHGPYRVVAIRTFRAAVAAAARALRLTRRPVGLLVWHGAHAWVMSGFSATADPAQTSAFGVTSVRISDPWYPRTTGAYGRTHRPDSRISLAELARNFLRWHRPLASYAELDGRFVLVLPTA